MTYVNNNIQEQVHFTGAVSHGKKEGQDSVESVHCLQTVLFRVIVTLGRNVIFRRVGIRVILKSVPVLCLHLKVFCLKLSCTQMEK
jgi:hypothetical protein